MIIDADIIDANMQLKEAYEDRFTHVGVAVQQGHAYAEDRLDELNHRVTGLRAGLRLAPLSSMAS